MVKTRQKVAKNGSFEGIGKTNLLDHLDQKINGYYEKKEEYPKAILMSKDTKDKLFIELKETPPDIDNCWIDKRDNYRGLKIEIKEDIFIELRG
jgi:hypothetical protein